MEESIVETTGEDKTLRVETSEKSEKRLLTAAGYEEEEIDFSQRLPKESILTVEFVL